MLVRILGQEVGTVFSLTEQGPKNFHCSGLPSNQRTNCFRCNFACACSRGGATQVVTMPPPKEHFFNIRTPPGTSVGEAIDAMEALVAIEEIYSVQHHGGFDFQAGVNSIQAAQDLLETGCLRLGTRVDPLVPVARQVASVTCLYLLCYVPDNEVATSLKSFGTTLRKEKARYKDRNSLRMGARYISWRIHSRILHEWAARPTFEYRGVRHLCNLEGHKAQCDTPHCG